MVVDVEGFGDPARTNLDQLAVREALYEALARAFAESGIGWGSCVSEDRGDGALILIPPEVPKARLVTGLPGMLAAAVTRHNTGSSAPERMRLRVALHAGEVYHDAHGVAGAAVNHAFRLAEAAQLRSALAASPGVLALIVSDWLFTEVVRHDPAAVPGAYRQVQVTVKETTVAGWIRVPGPAAAPAGAGPPGLPDRDGTVVVRGDARLAGSGLTGAVRGLPGAGLAAGDGGMRAWRPIPAQLPHDAGGFTGREPELADLASVAAGRGDAAVVITAIDGIAGIGKTALAVHFAHRAAAAFPDGQLFVNLRGFDPGHPPLVPEDVLARFMRALGADPADLPADPEELAAMYRSQLSGRRVLVVLDNAASAEQVRPLLPGTEGCLAIITSRNRLSGLVAVDGAQRLTLDVLPPGQAAALVARIAGHERAAADPAATRRLAELCGRLPLALRIAADRAAAHPHLSMAGLAGELTAESGRLDVLATDDQASQIRAVFSWSYRALASASARAFRFLGLHPGQDISIAAAAALLGAPFPQTRQLLRSLASGHLLEETGQDRYQFHDLVRVYAAERARASDPEPHRTAAVRRLLTWYLHAADAFERVFNPDHALLPLGTPPSWCKPPAFTTHLQAWRWAESEFANLGPVLRRAATAGDDVLAWQLPVAFMIIYDLSGRMAELIPALRSALATSRELGDRAAQAQILRHLAEACMNAGQLDEAIGCCRDAFAIYTETGDWYGQWSARQIEGRACLFLGQLSQATDRLEQSLATARQASDPWTEGMSLTWLGAVHERLGASEAAIVLREQAVAALKQTRNRWQYAYTLHKLGEAYHRLGRAAEAVGTYQQAQAIFRQIGDRHTQAEVLFQLGRAQEAAGQGDAARQSWQQALALFQAYRDPRASQVRAKLGIEANAKAAGPDRPHHR